MKSSKYYNKLAKKVKFTKSELDQLNMIDKFVTESAKKGEFLISIKVDEFSNKVIQKLLELGFRITQTETNVYVINWM